MGNLFPQKILKIGKWVVGIYILFKISVFLLERIEIKRTIEEKSNIKISLFFKEIENDILHTTGAFDSDYTWYFKLKVNESDYESISRQIENSKFYNLSGIDDLSNSIYDSLKLQKLKGGWTSEGEFYEFHEIDEKWKERTKIEIDKKERTIRVILVHL